MFRFARARRTINEEMVAELASAHERLVAKLSKQQANGNANCKHRGVTRMETTLSRGTTTLLANTLPIRYANANVSQTIGVPRRVGGAPAGTFMSPVERVVTGIVAVCRQAGIDSGQRLF